MALRTATVRAARMLSPDVRELTLDPGADFHFVPGQWVSLRIPTGDGEVVARSYSLASAPRADGCFDLAVTRVEAGPGSSWLHAAAPGDEVAMTDATGFFTLPWALARPLLMVATGTGIAPFRSMLQAMVAGGFEVPVVVLFGVRSEGDVLYAKEFAEMARFHPQVRFEVTLSRAEEGWRGRRGYVQTHLAELVASLGGGCDVYACGLSAMIRDVRGVLKDELGFTRERIHTERYD